MRVYAHALFALPLARTATHMAESDFESALRYRTLAEQTRIAARGAITDSARDRLLKAAADYQALAEKYELKFRKQNA